MGNNEIDSGPDVKAALSVLLAVLPGLVHLVEGIASDVPEEHKKSVDEWLTEQSETAKAMAQRFPGAP